MGLIAGIDGCRSGWFCLTEDMASGEIDARIISNIEEILGWQPSPEVVTVDVPIGIPDVGYRVCDIEARKRLGYPRASSVFLTPVRAVLLAGSYGEACEINRKRTGKMLSKQTWNIIPKIREMDGFVRGYDVEQTWIREIHPEVSFWAWNGGRAMKFSKRVAQGQQEREHLIRTFYGVRFDHVKEQLGAKGFKCDDLLDAFAALWSARRIVNGKAIILPEYPPVDPMGLRMEIVV
ncbi:MAG: DUF429 domain-containing protein [Syntrophales bacterium]|nr:DUF429 domain-containing protein [Syntrophales bacterium]